MIYRNNEALRTRTHSLSHPWPITPTRQTRCKEELGEQKARIDEVHDDGKRLSPGYIHNQKQGMMEGEWEGKYPKDSKGGEKVLLLFIASHHIFAKCLKEIYS
jgi:hypothetical protein